MLISVVSSGSQLFVGIVSVLSFVHCVCYIFLCFWSLLPIVCSIGVFCYRLCFSIVASFKYLRLLFLSCCVRFCFLGLCCVVSALRNKVP